MDTLTSIKVFRQVVESGSFVGAAERLDISTAMVSKHVMAIEKRLHIRLLNRNTRKLSLTEPGRFYLERCTAILQDLHRTERELESFSSAPVGTLRVACSDACIPGLGLANVIAEYRRQYPDVALDISFVEGAVDLVGEGYDLALRLVQDQSLPAGVVARKVQTVPFRLAASRAYLERHGAPKTPEDLREHDFVTTGSSEALELETPQGSVEVPIRVALRCRTLSDVAMSVAGGVGLALLPAALLIEQTFAGVLKPVLADFHPKASTLYLIYSDRKHLPLKTRAFVDLLVPPAAPRRERTKPEDVRPRQPLVMREPRMALAV